MSLCGILALAPLACWSQSAPNITPTDSQALSEGGRPGGDWRISVGAGAVVTPRFIGANKLRTLGVPTFDVQYQDWFFANPIRGIGVETHPVTGLSLTAAVGVDLSSRTSSEDPRLRGLPKNDFAPALKLGAEYEFHDFTVNAELSQRLASSAKSGAKARFEEGYNFIANRKLSLTGGFFQEIMNKTYARNFVSISPFESGVTGLAPYDAKSGLLDAGVYAQALYRITDHWVVFTKADYSRLAKNAGNSPIVQNKDQAMLLLFLNYSF